MVNQWLLVCKVLTPLHGNVFGVFLTATNSVRPFVNSFQFTHDYYVRALGLGAFDAN